MKSAQRIGLSLMIALLALAARAEERPGEKASKGMELYSWQDANGAWVFALLAGTNRLKLEDEIKAEETQIAGLETLEKHLSRLAEGEDVYWSHHYWPLSKQTGFAFPDRNTIKRIAAAAREARVTLHLPSKNGEDASE
jgi:hypothetical protein